MPQWYIFVLTSSGNYAWKHAITLTRNPTEPQILLSLNNKRCAYKIELFSFRNNTQHWNIKFTDSLAMSNDIVSLFSYQTKLCDD